MTPLSFLIVGSGYRSEYYGRIAGRYPDLFRAAYLCRSKEKAEKMTLRTGAPAFTDKKDALSFAPDFVVVAVDRGHTASVTREWAEAGFAVAAETPLGCSEEELALLYSLSREGAKIYSLEQYHRHPLLEQGFRAVKEGKIGTPGNAYLSLVHDYHAASLLRRMLQVSGEEYVLRGQKSDFETTETDSREGAILDGRTSCRERDTVFVTYSSGKTAIYDFSSVQYRTFIHSRHLCVRGSKGEWNDTWLYSVGEDGLPQREALLPRIAEKYRCLDTQGLRDIRKTWTGELFLDTQWDEYAIASMLLDTREYLIGGPSPYPFEEALEDAWFWLLLQKAVEAPWQPFSSADAPWKRQILS